jgi:eukaryotic-like serine/threonine-protein kinase
MTQLGKYQLVSKLATGGMAEVYLSRAAGPGDFEKTLVLKRILPHLAEDPAFVQMFLSEARLAARLDHPNIVQIFDFGQQDGTYYLAMEYIDGLNLRVLLKQAQLLGLALPPASCARILTGACEGLAYAHDRADTTTGEPLNLIHRDISPDNLLLSRQGTVKVVDFGIAKVADQGHRTQTGVVKGKLAYMAPEQLQGKTLDRRVDVYALGVVFYELLTGHKPFDANSEASLMHAIVFEPPVPAQKRRSDLPSALQRILDRALAKEREQRYPDCRAFHADLERFILSTGEPVGAWQLAQLVERVRGSTAQSPAQPPSLPSAVESSLVSPRDAAVTAPLPTAPALAVPEPVEPETEAHRTWGPRGSRVGAMAGAGTVLLLLLAGGGYVLSQKPEASAVQAPQAVVPPASVEPSAPPRAAPGTSASVKPANVEGAPPSAEVAKPDVPQAVETAQGKGSPPPVEVAKPEVPPVPTGPVIAQAPVSPAPASPDKAPRPARVEPKPAPRIVQQGTLEVRVTPRSIAILDGKPRGLTPLAPLSLPAGSHTLRIINTGLGKDLTLKVEVKANENLVFTRDLQAQ